MQEMDARNRCTQPKNVHTNRNRARHTCAWRKAQTGALWMACMVCRSPYNVLLTTSGSRAAEGGRGFVAKVGCVRGRVPDASMSLWHSVKDYIGSREMVHVWLVFERGGAQVVPRATVAAVL